ncbi:MBL fold metallo-hydrolase [Dyella solisilvae]|uniref:MBL fold metallo-hydrolase n=1 Tax=Dyella solisilvae TaxID=1920168 RepID=A0A370KBK0_9GAMM|nr:MBL fold metallo-hydrolase [Dyella solisilvae]RDI99440.1 MBL fold metallo-hydrolase [Dyella solisilvae]
MQSSLVYSCHGAAKQVTGSCHLLRCGEHQVLIDCGMFQGRHEEEQANTEPFGFDPAQVDALLLTHAHLDHCGRIPRLVRQGFRGRIITTAATRDLARIVLLDAARLQEEDAARNERSGHRRGEPAPEPLSTLDDAFRALNLFADPAGYDQVVPVAQGITAQFLDAGHILGSASILLTLGEGAQQRRMLFSGDLGSSGRPILRDPTPAPPADYVVMESTYGDRDHRALPDSIDELYEAVSSTLARGGNVIIPTFALERAQEVLYYLHQGMRQQRIPEHTPVFLDSPMAISATDVFRRHPECFDEEFAATLRQDDPFSMPNLRFSRDASDSMAINRIEGGAIIMAGSGMCNGGRVRHHLRHNLWRERSGIVFVGYAAEGTLARRIINGARRVSIFGEDIAVNARVWTINGFSAHAGRDELISWLGSHPRRTVFLVHGEVERGMQAMESALAARGVTTRLPGMHEPIVLD